jgi:hypothetical protein
LKNKNDDSFPLCVPGGLAVKILRDMKIVLAYSGGLDTSVLMSWIKEKYNAEMIGFCADIGQEEELDGLEKPRRIKTGASKIYIDDLQEEFARDFIYPIIQSRRDLRRPILSSAPASRVRSSPSAWWRLRKKKKPTPLRTARPEKVMTKCASS